MNNHPLLRAYLAGIAVPTIFLVIVATLFTLVPYVYNAPIPIERVIVFPMAFVPNLWGLWNVLHAAFFTPGRLSLGIFGCLLPLLLAPLGYFIARMLEFPIPYHIFLLSPIGPPVELVACYH